MQQRAVELDLRQWIHKTAPALDATLVTEHGGPLDILREASQNAELLVLGHSAHRVLGRALNGHIADDLIPLAQCPVAVIPCYVDAG